VGVGNTASDALLAAGAEPPTSGHVAFEVTWSGYEAVIDAYQADQPAEGKKIMTRLVDSLTSGVPGPRGTAVAGAHDEASPR
jgi:hypothetical protein